MVRREYFARQSSEVSTLTQDLTVLFELDSSDSRCGAVREILDLAKGLRGRGVRCYVCGALTADFAALARISGMEPVYGRSRMFSRSGYIPYFANALMWMRKLYRIKPSIIHLNYSTWGASLACAANRMGIPVVGRAMARFHAGNPSNRWISAYIANSEAHADGLLKSPLANKVHIANAVIFLERGLEMTSASAPVPPKEVGRVRYIFLGQLVKRKGIEYLLRAAAKTNYAAEFVLVGGDWSESGYPQEMRSLVNELGLGDRVHLLNHRADIGPLLSSSDVFVLPSLSEARPRSIIEAMHAGLPIVSTSVGAIPTMVEEGRNGLLVPPGDATELAKALDVLCESADIRRRFGEVSREKATVDCDVSAATDAHLKVYRRVLRARSVSE